jgi:hypothetical protein
LKSPGTVKNGHLHSAARIKDRIMEPYFGDFWRLDGPGQLRLIVQPLIAIFLGLRSARQDVMMGLAPYISRIVTTGRRVDALRHGLRVIAVSITLAVSVDSIVQYSVWGRVGLVAALIVGIILVALPYIVARDLGNRFWPRPNQPRPAPDGVPPAPDEAATRA